MGLHDADRRPAAGDGAAVMAWLTLLFVLQTHPCNPLIPPGTDTTFKTYAAGSATIGWCHDLSQPSGNTQPAVWTLWRDGAQVTTLTATKLTMATNGWWEFQAPFTILTGQHIYTVRLDYGGSIWAFSDTELRVDGISGSTSLPVPGRLVVR